MEDEEIIELGGTVARLRNLNTGAYVAYLNRNQFAGAPDGPMGPKHYVTAHNKILDVRMVEGEPVAILDDGKGSYVALWNCDTADFVYVKPFFKKPKQEQGGSDAPGATGPATADGLSDDEPPTNQTPAGS